MPDTEILAGYDLGDLFVLLFQAAAWSTSSIWILAALLSIPVLLSLPAFNGALTTGLLGLALTMLAKTVADANTLEFVQLTPIVRVWEPLFLLFVIFFAIITAAGGLSARRRALRLRLQKGQLDAEVKSLQFLLERERLWRNASGVPGSTVPDPERQNIPPRVEGHSDART